MTEQEKTEIINKIRVENPEITVPDNEFFIKDTDGKEYLSLAVRWQLDKGQSLIPAS